MNEADLNLKARPFCSMEYWYPKIKNIARTPTSVIVPLPPGVDIAPWLENGPDPHMVALLKSQAKPLGYPLFMRTDQTSGKHEWDRTCYVTKEQNIAGQLRWLLESNYMQNMFGEITPHSIVLREFLPLKTFFKCTMYHNMPVAREFRCFATNGKIECVHPYWPHGALVDGRPDNPNWQELLPELEDDSHFPTIMVTDVSKKFPEQWSIDVCEDKWGKYWLTDMALGSVSFHWKHGEKSGDDKGLARALRDQKEWADMKAKIK